jgi:hypothetical protein
MFELFRVVDGGIVAMGDLFRAHVDFEGNVLVQRRVTRCSAAVDEPVEGLLPLCCVSARSVYVCAHHVLVLPRVGVASCCSGLWQVKRPECV